MLGAVCHPGEPAQVIGQVSDNEKSEGENGGQQRMRVSVTWMWVWTYEMDMASS